MVLTIWSCQFRFAFIAEHIAHDEWDILLGDMHHAKSSCQFRFDVATGS